MVQQPLPFIDYTARDFESVKQALINYLEQRFPESFTDFSESQLGIALLEQVAYPYAILSFMLDRLVNENFITTARERRSIIRLSALLGYKLSTGTAASVTLQGDTEALRNYNQPVIVTAGTQVTAGDLVFETPETYTIQRIGTAPNYLWTVNGGTPLPTVSFGATEGETIVDTFTATGEKFSRFICSRSPLISGTLSVQVSGATWTLVESLTIGNTNNTADGQIYEITLDEEDLPTVVFGDGASGDIPEEGETISITYRIGGGSRGNVAARAINTSIGATTNSQTITFNVVNLIGGSGGTDREDIEHARIFAPQFAKSMDRAITYNDYFYLCNGFTDSVNGTIAKAGVISDPSDGLSNVVTIYTWSEDGNGNLVPANQPLKDALRQFLDQRRVLSVYISPIQDGENIPLDITLFVRVSDDFDRQTVLNNVTTEVNALFQENRVRFGNEFRYSWLCDRIQDVPGVAWFHVKQFGNQADPRVVQGSAVEIWSGTLPDQSGLNNDQVRIQNNVVNSPRDFYCNFRLRIGTQTGRIIASDPTTTNPFVIVTLDRDLSPNPSLGDPYRITHPRRIRFDSSVLNNLDFYNGRMLVVDSPSAGVVSQERSIIDYEADRIAVVNEDWLTNPVAGQTYKLLPDYKVIDSQSIVPGNIIVESIV